MRRHDASAYPPTEGVAGVLVNYEGTGMAVILIGTLDTKGSEIAFVRDRLKFLGVDVLVIDAGVVGNPLIQPDIPADRLFESAGTTLAKVRERGDRGEAVTLAAQGSAKLILDLHHQGKVDGILGLGGSAGATIGTSAMRALPFGIPKLMVTTLASGQTRPYVGSSDIMMLHSVADISGINRISRTVLSNAASAMAGMVKTPMPSATGDKPIIAATMFGVTTPCVEACRAILESHGYEVLVFHAVGTGGQAMESLIRDGLVTGVLDITTTELADELVGGTLSAGSERLTSAAHAGIPQVVSVGAVDMVNFGPRESVPASFNDRQFYIHNPTVTLMRTTPEENRAIGLDIARKVRESRGPYRVLLPKKGVSAIDAEGKPFANPEADEALFATLREEVPRENLLELDLHINDAEFAQRASQELLQLIKR